MFRKLVILAFGLEAAAGEGRRQRLAHTWAWGRAVAEPWAQGPCPCVQKCNNRRCGGPRSQTVITDGPPPSSSRAGCGPATGASRVRHTGCQWSKGSPGRPHHCLKQLPFWMRVSYSGRFKVRLLRGTSASPQPLPHHPLEEKCAVLVHFGPY